MWVHVVIFVMILCALTGWKKGWIPSSGIGGKDGIRLFAVVAIAGNLLGMILTLQNGGQVYPQGYRLEKEDTGSYEKEFMVSVDGDVQRTFKGFCIFYSDGRNSSWCSSILASGGTCDTK